jgi:hypothetical protein
MKAIAFSNNDIAVAAWTFGGRITGCLGFAIYRIDVKAGTETCLPALATFPNQDATASRTTAQDPVQKFFWKDVYAKRGGSYSYRIVPMGGQPGAGDADVGRIAHDQRRTTDAGPRYALRLF